MYRLVVRYVGYDNLDANPTDGPIEYAYIDYRQYIYI